MALIEQPVEIAAAPSEEDDEVGSHGVRESLEGVELDATNTATLGERYLILADAGVSARVLLAPAESMAERSQPPPDPHAVHVAKDRDQCVSPAHPRPI